MDLTDKNSFHPPLWDCQAEEEGRIFSQHQESPGQPGARKTSQSSKLDLINLAAFNETLIYSYTGCPKKNAWSCFLAITPLWKGVGRKVGGVLKTSGNSLCDRHKNFPNWPFRSWENWVQRWQLSLKNLEKNWENLLKPLLSIYLFWPLKMCCCSLFYGFSCYQIVGIRRQMSKDKFKHYRVSQKIS